MCFSSSIIIIIVIILSNSNSIKSVSGQHAYASSTVYFICVMVLNSFAISTNQFIQHVDHYNSIVLENLWEFKWFFSRFFVVVSGCVIFYNVTEIIGYGLIIISLASP